jgi:hypothetical protein
MPNAAQSPPVLSQFAAFFAICCLLRNMRVNSMERISLNAARAGVWLLVSTNDSCLQDHECAYSNVAGNQQKRGSAP